MGLGERVRALLAGLFFLSIPAALVPGVPAWLPLVTLAATALANVELLRLFHRRKGALFALGGLLFHQVYYVYSGAAFTWCWFEARLRPGVRAP